MAREPAFGVVTLRRFASRACGRERAGRGVIVERAPSPSTAVCEPLAVFHHEINVMLGTWHRWLSGVRFLLFRVPMDLRHFSAIWRSRSGRGARFSRKTRADSLAHRWLAALSGAKRAKNYR